MNQVIFSVDRTAGTDSPIGSGDLKPEAFPPDAQASLSDQVIYSSHPTSHCFHSLE